MKYSRRLNLLRKKEFIINTTRKVEKTLIDIYDRTTRINNIKRKEMLDWLLRNSTITLQ